jgi:hypothetical protein
MTNYQVTIGYKAVISISIKAVDEDDAKEQAVEIMKKQRDKMFKRQDFELQDDSFAAHGVLDMDETWNMVQS